MRKESDDELLLKLVKISVDFVVRHLNDYSRKKVIK